VTFNNLIIKVKILLALFVLWSQSVASPVTFLYETSYNDYSCQTWFM